MTEEQRKQRELLRIKLRDSYDRNTPVFIMSAKIRKDNSKLASKEADRITYGEHFVRKPIVRRKIKYQVTTAIRKLNLATHEHRLVQYRNGDWTALFLASEHSNADPLYYRKLGFLMEGQDIEQLD